MKTAIIIGGTSGIGRGLSEKYANNGWKVAVTGRRTELLQEIATASNQNILTLTHDVTEIDSSDKKLQSLFDRLGPIDLAIVSAGVSELNQELDWSIQEKVITTNVNGIAKVYQFLFTKFRAQGHGHIVGISSIAAIRGNRHGPSYGAAKAFQANYLEAMRCIAINEQLNIKITDVQPGFVDTPMAKGEGKFWVASVPKTVDQIYSAIQKEKRKVYVTKRWRLIAWILKVIPSWVLEKV